MRYSLLAFVLLAGAAPAAAQTMETASGDWSNVPVARQRGDARMHPETIDRVLALAGERSCNVPGLRPGNVRITVPFVLQFGASGSVERIVMRDVGCPQLQDLMGGVVRQLAQRGEYQPTGENQTGWYRSEISLSSR